MNIISSISGIFKPVASLIDNITTSDEERLKLGNELAKIENNVNMKLLDLEAEKLKAQSSIIVAEANAQSWMQRNWRPITMLTFLVLVVCDSFGILTFRLSESAWDLLKLGLGGYVVGRSAEKIIPKLKGN